MGFEAKVVCDSLAPCGKRLTTVEITYPRFIHAEILTHRDRERNSGSSRAIPWPTMCERISNEPVIPIYWGKNQKGMQTGNEVDAETCKLAEAAWLRARDACLKEAQVLHELGIHKSLCNRLTEPWMWITVVMTATEWKNFFRLRCHKDAEVHFQKIAGMIRDAYQSSSPRELKAGQWHLPYVEQDDVPASWGWHLGTDSLSVLKRVSTARVARVSYVQHGEKRKSVEKDLELFKTLSMGSDFGHWSPTGHVAEALPTPERSGPFIGFKQFRKEFANENIEG